MAKKTKTAGKARPAKKAAKKKSRYAESKMNPVVHFELPMDDTKRIRKFYHEAFGWETMDAGGDNAGYILAHSGETTKDGMLKETGMINGGFYNRDADKPGQHPSLVIAVMDIKKHMKRIEKAGGKVLGDPVPIPGYGTYVAFYDTEGNRLSIIEPDDQWKDKTK